MKIIDVAEYYADGGGGIRTYILAKLKAAQAKGHEIVVVAPGREDRTEEREGGRIRWIKGPAMPFDNRYGVLWNMKQVHRILEEEKADVVEASSVWAGGQFVARWKGQAVKSLIFHQDPVAVIPHTYLDQYASRDNIDRAFAPIWAYLRGVSRKFDTTVVSGNWLKDRLDSFGLEHVEAVPFGIDKAFFKPERRSEDVRRKWLAQLGLGPEALLLLVVSRYHPEKRLDVLFQAVEEVQKHRPAGCIVFGAGNLPAKAARLAEKNPHILLAGYTKDRDELAAIYASADMMIHGSAAETYGLGVAEAICSGLPVVAPSVGGAADLVKSNAGLLYEPGDNLACAEAVLEVARLDRADLSAGSRNAATTINTVERHFELLFETYARRVAEKKRGP